MAALRRGLYSVVYGATCVPGVLPLTQALLSPRDADIRAELAVPGADAAGPAREVRHENDPGAWPEDGSAHGQGLPRGMVQELTSQGWVFRDAVDFAAASSEDADADADATATATATGAAETESSGEHSRSGWAPETEDTTTASDAETTAARTSLSVATYNVMIDTYNKFIPGIIHTPRRYAAILHELRTLDADIVSLNEATPLFLDSLCADPWIRATYRLTDVSPDAAVAGAAAEAGKTYRVHGVVVLLRKSLQVLSMHAISSVIERPKGGVEGVRHSPARPSVCVRVNLGGDRVLALVGTHLEAYNTRFRMRRQQLRDLYRLLRLRSSDADASASASADATAAPGGASGSSGSGGVAAAASDEANGDTDRVALDADQALILGDFNLHQESESAIIDGGYTDLWSLLRPAPDTSVEEGYTWDARVNSLIKAMWLECDVRRMRLDRVILSGVSDSLPASTEAAARAPAAPRGRAILRPRTIRRFADQPVPVASPGDPDWLFPSDHFGLVTTFDLA